MKLSIVIPVYNVREYLGACIESLAIALGRGEFAAEVEMVAVDDGSTDGSSELLDILGRDYKWLRVFHRPNRGVAAARNYALGEVTGEYLTWVDPDDLVEADYFHALFKAFAVRPDAVIFDYRNLPGRTRHYRNEGGSFPVAVVWRDLIRDERLKSFLCCKVVRRKLIPAKLFDETCAVMSDFEAMGRLFRKVKTVEYLHEALYIYRQRNGSIVNQPVPERMNAMSHLALKRLEEVDAAFHADALSCAMYHAYHYCHMAAKFPNAEWNRDGRLNECRRFIRCHFFAGLKDSRNGLVRKFQFLMVATGLMKAAVVVRRWLPGGRDR